MAATTTIASCQSWSFNQTSWRNYPDCKSSFICCFLNPSTTSFGTLRSRPLGFRAEGFARSSFWRPFADSSHSSRVIVAAVNRDSGNIERSKTLSPWDDKPFVLLPNGTKSYLDEQDVVTYLDDPARLIPFDPSSYNPAAYLWAYGECVVKSGTVNSIGLMVRMIRKKKISEIPEERRYRLLFLLMPKQITAAWAVAGSRYDHPKLSKKSASRGLTGAVADNSLLESWNCCKSGGPMPFSLMYAFKMALFHQDGQVYGRFMEDSLLGKVATSFSPLYFTVHRTKEVMPTEQPCDMALEFGDGLLDFTDIPEGFPKPAKHPKPFDDQVIVYIRFLGPGVMVGQAWQEGLDLDQVPKKLCGEILMLKDYNRFK